MGSLGTDPYINQEDLCILVSPIKALITRELPKRSSNHISEAYCSPASLGDNKNHIMYRQLGWIPIQHEVYWFKMTGPVTIIRSILPHRIVISMHRSSTAGKKGRICILLFYGHPIWTVEKRIKAGSVLMPDMIK